MGERASVLETVARLRELGVPESALDPIIEWAVVCERVCEYAMEIGMPEYSGVRSGGCGNCRHYFGHDGPAHREQATNHPGDVLGDAAEVASEGERDE